MKSLYLGHLKEELNYKIRFMHNDELCVDRFFICLSNSSKKVKNTIDEVNRQFFLLDFRLFF